MPEPEPPAQNEVGDESDHRAQWPLSYRIRGALKPKQWWSHKLYRGPDNKAVEILYSNNKAHSEELAKLFLDEPIIGFDMEWPWDSEKGNRLQEKIGLIQVASEDKIALFHIGLHAGKASHEIIAPSLRKLIESPVIAKAGVNILYADFWRLKKFFGLKPQAALELSHLHRLVKFGIEKPELCTTKLASLAYQVEEHLGLPLSKGKVRTSNWSRPLSQQQINYAAGDAYAGFMLFHCMNAKRVAMDPVPPLPILADRYPSRSGNMPPITKLLLHPLEEGGELVFAMDFFKPKEAKAEATADERGLDQHAEDVTSPAVTVRKTRAQASKPTAQKGLLDATSQALYEQLSLRRRALANEEGLPAYIVASNAVLQGLARQRPLDDDQLLQVKGIGKKVREKFGAEWLEVIAQFLATSPVEGSISASIEMVDLAEDAQPFQQPITPTRKPRRRKAIQEDSGSSSPAFGSPVQRVRHLHTGLSFTLAETNLGADVGIDDRPPSPTILGRYPSMQQEATLNLADAINPKGKQLPDAEDSDDQEMDSDDLSNSPSSFVTPLSQPGSQLKRKRDESLSSVRDHTTSQEEPELLHPVPLTPRSRIFRNKLVAFSRLVTRKLNSRTTDASPIVSERTLDQIVAIVPQTLHELHGIPGIEGFVQACKETDMDLMKNILKFAPARF